jgi:hypothetical protein
MHAKEIQLKETARFFKVLADEARLKMLWLLFNHRELCVCDIMAALEITQSKASRHLAALRNGPAQIEEIVVLLLAPLVTTTQRAPEASRKLSPSGCETTAGELDSWLKVKKAARVPQQQWEYARTLKAGQYHLLDR